MCAAFDIEPRRQGEAGQAITELVVLTPLFVLLLLMVHQVYLATRTVYRATTSMHAEMFAQAYNHNCAERREDCTYNSDLRGKVVWTPERLPEVYVPGIAVFERNGVARNLRLWSNSPLNRRVCKLGEDCLDVDELCPDKPCKRTKLGVGTYESFAGIFRDAVMHPDPLARLLLQGR